MVTSLSLQVQYPSSSNALVFSSSPSKSQAQDPWDYFPSLGLDFLCHQPCGQMWVIPKELILGGPPVQVRRLSYWVLPRPGSESERLVCRFHSLGRQLKLYVAIDASLGLWTQNLLKGCVSSTTEGGKQLRQSRQEVQKFSSPAFLNPRMSSLGGDLVAV